MNKIYKVIWNATLGTWVAVSEVAKGKTKSSKTNTTAAVVGAAVVGLMVTFSPNAMAAYAVGGGTTTGAGGLAIGNGAGQITQAGGQEAIAIGANTYANGEQSTVIGNDVRGNGNQSVIIGSNYNANPTTSTGLGGVAIGSGLTATLKSPMANGTGSVALGSSGDGTTNTYNGAVATGSHSLAMMAGANASAVNSISVGVNTSTTGESNVSIGTNASTGNTTSGVQDQTTLGVGGGGQIAIGSKAKTDTVGSIALGANAQTGASSNFAIAIGGLANAAGNSAIAFGRASQAAGHNALAFGGRGTNAAGIAATAIGSFASATGKESTAIGGAWGEQTTAPSTIVASDRSVAIGSSQIKKGADYSLAFGYGAEVSGLGKAVALGANTIVTGTSSVAIGDTANAQGGLGTIAIGSSGVKSWAENSIAIGSGAEAGIDSANKTNTNSKQTGAIAIGTKALSYGVSSASMGENAKAYGENSYALGTNSEARTISSVAVGDQAKSTGVNALALGANTGSHFTSSVAIGDNAQVGKDKSINPGAKDSYSSIAIGDTSNVQGDSSIALGNRATVNADQAIAIGNGAVATGEQSISIGTGNKVAAKGSGAIGDPTEITVDGTGTYVLGNNNGTVDATESGIMGNNNTVTTGLGITGTRVIGNNNTISSSKVMVLGNNVNVGSSLDGAVVLGDGSSVISATPTSNATVTGKHADAKSINYGTFAGIKPDTGDVVSVGAQGKERQIQYVAAGRINADSTDAINGSQLYATQEVISNLAGTTAKALGGGAGVGPTGAILQPTYSLTNNPHLATTKTSQNVGDALSTLNTAVNQPITITGTSGSTTQKLGSAVAIIGDSKNVLTEVTAGQVKVKMSDTPTFNSVTVINPPSKGTDATNKTYVDGVVTKAKTTVTEGDNITVTSSTNGDGSTNYNVATKKEVSFDKVTVGNVVTDSTTNTITGVEAGSIGAGSKDVVNGGQIHDLVGQGAYVDNKGNVTNTVQNIGGTGANNIDDAIKNVNTTAKAAKTEVKQGDNILVTEAKGKDGQSIYTVATDKNVKFDNVTVGGVQIDSTTNKITGLTDGTVAAGSKDAVTGNQLNKAADNFTTVLGGNATNVGGTVTTTDIGGTGANNIDDAIKNVSTAATKAKTTVTEGNNITVTSSTNTDGSTNYEVATAKEVSFDKVTVGNVVTDSTTNTITGVEAGSIGAGSKDVVNGGQIHDLVGQGAYVDNKGNVTNTVQNIGGTGANNIDDAIKNVNTTAKAAKTEVKQGDNILVTEAKGKDGQSIYTVATDKNVKFDNVTVGGVQIDSTTNKITGLTDGTVAAGSKDAVTGNQLNKAADNFTTVLGGNATNVGGTVTTTDIGGTGANNIDDAIKNVSTAATKAKTTVTEGNNITVTSSTNTDGSTNYEVATAKEVSFDKVTVGNVVTDSTTNTITGVEAGSIGAGSKDVVNGGQIHDLVGQGAYVDNKGNVTNTVQNIGGTGANNIDDAIKNVNTTAKAAKTEVKQGDNILVTEAKGKDGQSIYTVATDKNVKFDNVTVGGVQIDSTTNKITGLTDGTVAAGSKDAVTGNQLNKAADNFTTVLGGNATNVGGTVTTTDIGGTGANNIDDAIKNVSTAATKAKTTVTEGNNITVTSSTNTDGSTNYEVATAKEVSFDKVTVGNVVTDSTTNTITGVEAGSIGAGSKDVVNGSQVHDLVGQGAYVDNKGNVTNTVQNIGGTGANNIDDAIKNVNTTAKAAKTEVKQGDNILVTEAKGKDGQSIYTVATDKNVKFDNVTVGGVQIDGTTNKITGLTDGTVAAGSKDAVTGNQLNKAADNFTTVLGGNATNVGGTVTTTDIGGTGANNIDDAIKNVSTAATKAKTTVTEGNNITVTSSTNTDGSTNYEVATAKEVSFDKVTVGNVVTDSKTNTITGVEAGSIGAGSKDVVNGGQIHDLVGQGAYVDNKGNVTNTVQNIGGTGANNIDDAIKNVNTTAKAAKTEVKQGDNILVTEAKGKDGQSIYTVATDKNVKFDNVTVGGVQIDSTTNKITGLTDGTVAAGSKDAVTGNQLNKAADNFTTVLGGNATNVGGTVTTTDIGGTGANNIDDAIKNVSTAATKAKTTVTEGNNITVTSSTNTDGSTNYEVATAKEVSFDKVTVGNVVTDSKTNTITGVEAGSIGAGSKDVVNGGQIHDLVGQGAYVDNKGNVTNTVQNIGGTGANNIDDAIKNVNTTAKAAKTEVKQGDNILVTEAKGKDGQSIYTVATDKNVKFDNVTVGGVQIDGTTNKITGLTDGTVAAGSKDAVTGNQLNKAADNFTTVLGGNATNVGGTVTTTDIGGTGANNIDDAIKNVSTAATKAKTTVTEGNNITVTSSTNTDGSTNYEVATAKEVSFDKVTVGNVVTDSTTNTITGVEAGSIGAGSKDVVNGSQVHDLVGQGAYVDNKGNVTNTVQNIGGTGANNIDDAIKNVNTTAKAAKTEVKQGDNILVTEAKGKDGQSIYTVATDKNVKFDNVTVGGVQIDGTTNKITGLTDGTVAAGSKDAVTGNQLNKAADNFTTVLGGNATNVGGTVTTTDIGGTGANNIDDAIKNVSTAATKAKTTVTEGNNITVTSSTNTDGSTNYEVATAKEVSFDKVTVGNVVTDSTTNTITGVEAGSIGAGSKDVVNGSQIHDLVGQGAYVDNKGNVTNTVQNIGGTGANNIDDAIKNVNTTAKAAKTEVKQGDNILVTEAKGKDGQSIYTVATDKNVKFDNVTVGGVQIDGTTNKITGLTDGTVAAGSKDAVTGNQLNKAADNFTTVLGGNATNVGGTVTTTDIGGTGANNIDDAIKNVSTAATKAKTTVTEGNNITVTSSTNTDGSTNYEVATAKEVSFDKVTVGNVVTDSTTNTITGVEAGSIGAGSKDVVNGGQIHDLVGQGAYVDNKGNVTNTVQNIGGTGANNIDDAIKNVNTTAKAAKTEVKQGDNILVTEAKGKDGQSIYTVATDKNVKFDNVTVGGVQIDSTTNKITGLTDGTVAAGSKDAVTGNQLNKAADNFTTVLGGNATNVGGTVTTTDIGGTGANNIDDAIKNVSTAATKAKTTVTEGNNITVTSSTNTDGSTNYEVATAKEVSFDKVTVGNVVTDSTTNTITGVEAGSIGAGSKDVVNGSQVHDLVGQGAYVDNKGNVTNTVQNIGGTGANNIDDAIKNVNTTAKAAKTEVKQGDNILVTEAKGKDGQSIYTVATDKNVKFDNVTVGGVQIDGTTNKITGLTDGTVAAGSKDAVTGNQLNKAADNFTTVLGGNATNVGGTVTTTDIGGTGANNIDDAIKNVSTAATKAKTTVTEGNNITVTSSTNTDGSTNYEVATAKEVSFDKVTVGNVVTDSKTNTITGVEAGSIGAGSKDVVNGGQIHDLVGQGAYVDNKGNVTNTVQNIGGTGANNIDDAIKNVNTTAKAAKTEVKQGDNILVTEAKGKDGQSIYTVATDKNVKFDNVTVGGVQIDSTTNKITGLTDGTVAAGSKDAVTGNQLNKAADNFTTVLGGNATNVGGTVTTTDIGGTGANNIDDAIKNVSTAATKAKTTVTEGNNITVTSSTNTDGSTNYEVATAKEVSFDKVTVGNVVTDSKTNTITGVEAGSIGAGSKDVVNGGQIHDLVGQGAYVDNKGNVTNTVQNIGGTGANNIDDAIKNVNTTAKAAKTEVKQGDNILVTEAKGKDGQSIYTVATDKNVKFDNVTVGGVQIDGTTNKITGLTDGTVAAGSKDAVTGNQLNKAADNFTTVLGGNATNVGGTVTTTDIGGTGANNIDDAIKNVSTAATKAKTTVTEGNNITVTSSTNTDGSTNYEVATAKEVSFDKVTVGNVVTDSTTNTITGVEAGSIGAGSKDVVNGSQVHDLVGQGAYVDNKGNVTNTVQNIGGTGANNIDDAIKNVNTTAKAAKTEVKQGDNILVTEAKGKDGQSIYTVATDKNVKFDNVTVGGVQIDGTTNKITGLTDGTVAAGSKDAVTGNQLNKAADNFTTVLGGNATNVGGTVTTTDIGGTGANNIDDAIKNVSTAATKAKTTVTEGNNITVTSSTNTDGSTNYEVATAKEVSFDKVTVGNVVTDSTTNTITGVEAGSIGAGSKDVVNGSQIHDLVGQGAYVDNKGNVTNTVQNIGGTGANNIDDAIKNVNTTAKAAKTEVKQGDNILVTEAKGKDGQSIYTVATDKNVKFDNVTVGGVQIDGTTNKITGLTDGTVAAGSKDAVTGNQLNKAADNFTTVLGGNATNVGGTVTTTDIGGTGANNIDDAIKNVNTTAAKAKTTVTEGDNITVTSSTNKDGSTNYQVATAKDVKFDSVTVGPITVSNAGINAGNTQIKNLAAGTAGTDAVNVNQLNKVINQKIENDVTNIIGTTDGKPSPLFETYNVAGQNTTDRRNIFETVTNINTKGAKYFHTNAVDETVEGGVIGTTNDSSAGGQNSTAVGVNAIVATGADSSVALGHNTIVAATATNSLAAGSGASAGGVSTIAIGHGAQALGNQSISIGTGNIVRGNNSGALGDPSIIDGNNSYSVGNNNTVKTDNTFVLGNDVTQTVEGAVVLGDKSAATTGAGVAGYALAQANQADRDAIAMTTSSTGAVAVGDAANGVFRQITGVAAGTENSDAVNVAQLKAVDHQVTTTQKALVDSLGGKSTVNADGTITGPTYNVGGGTQTNVGDALDALNTAVTNVDTTANAGWTVKAGNQSQTIKPKASVEFAGDKNITVAQTSDKDGNAKLTVALNKNLEVEQLKAGDTVINTGGVSIGQNVQLGGTGLVIKNGPSVTTAGIDAGNTTIKNVAAGVKDTDAVNKGQLDGAINNINNKVDQVNNNAVQYDKNTDGTVNKNSVTLGGGDKGTTLTNVADGKVAQGSKDAVNGGQLWNVQQQVDQNTTDISNIENKINNGSLGLVQQTGGSKAEITVGKNTGGTTVNMAGKDGDRTVTGVKDGAINATSKDAVNGSQLNTTNKAVAEYLGGGASYNNITQSFEAPSYTVGDSKYNNVGGAIDALNKADQTLNSKIDNVSNKLEQAFYSTNQRIDDVEKRANAGIAAAMALETAPYIPGKYTYAAAAAHHGGENAVGVTLRKTADNGRWSLTGGIAAASEGDPSFRIGISGVID